MPEFALLQRHYVCYCLGKSNKIKTAVDKQNIAKQTKSKICNIKILFKANSDILATARLIIFW